MDGGDRSDFRRRAGQERFVSFVQNRPVWLGEILAKVSGDVRFMAAVLEEP
jgi:hypothetical protein